MSDQPFQTIDNSSNLWCLEISTQLSAPVCKYRESSDRIGNSKFLLFCQKDLYDFFVLEIWFKSSCEVKLILHNLFLFIPFQLCFCHLSKLNILSLSK